MVYDGLEVDMLSLGNADSILVTQWYPGGSRRILIDGGKTGDSKQILAFLAGLGIKHLDYVVCSHPHEDHAGGLLDLIKSKQITIGELWMHLPLRHIDELTLRLTLGLGNYSAKKIVSIINKSLDTTHEIEAAATAKGIPIYEPFKDKKIGFLHVCGPSQEFYEQQLINFTDLEKLAEMQESMNQYQNKVSLEDMYENSPQMVTIGTGLGEAPTEPENDSSTILWTKHGPDQLLFTADAGVKALEAVKSAYNIGNLRWMQIPHHGSRRNINEELISFFRPKTAYVSADGTPKHPRKKVVTAFQTCGSEVFSTHYPSGFNLNFHVGNVPPRIGYSAATPLPLSGRAALIGGS